MKDTRVWNAERRSLAIRLWYQLRGTTEVSDYNNLSEKPTKDLVPPGARRPVTYHNFRLTCWLAKLVLPPFFGQIWALSPIRMTIWLAQKAIVPIFTSWSNLTMARLLDAVQACLQSPAEGTARLTRGAVWHLFVSSASEILEYILRDNERVVHYLLNTELQELYLQSQLSQSSSEMRDPHTRELLNEAGIVAGHVQADWTPEVYYGAGGYQHVSLIIHTINSLISAFSSFFILTYTLWSSSSQGQESWTMSCIALGIIALPMIVQTSLAYLPKPRPQWTRYSWHNRLHTLLSMANNNPRLRQEVQLFGLRSWIIKEWKKEKQRHFDWSRSRTYGHSLLESIAQKTVDGSVYFLCGWIALFHPGSSLTLGTVRLYEAFLTHLIASIRSFNDHLTGFVWSTSLITSFLSVTTLLPTVTKNISYEDVRKDDWSTSGEMSKTGMASFYRLTKSGPRPSGMRIEAKGLYFSYPSTNSSGVQDINITLEAGSTLAIVGPNGGGKSTLLKCLIGIYDCQGQVLINGVPIELLDRGSIHRRTTGCFQDFNRYNLSVRENVGLGKSEQLGKDDVILEAMYLANASNAFERKLDQGIFPEAHDQSQPCLNYENNRDLSPIQHKEMKYGTDLTSSALSSQNKQQGNWLDTMMWTGEESENSSPVDEIPNSSSSRSKPNFFCLSGGEWQRVALARAFMKADTADLLVFDEPSASLDPHSEKELFDRIQEINDGPPEQRRTVIFTSHRLSTVRHADYIAYMEGGRIIEYGTHSELMAIEKGKYKTMWELQASAFVDRD